MRQPRTPDQALADTLALLPDGAASTHSPDTVLGARFAPLANELSNLETSAIALIPEAIDPRAATDLLTDWEAEMDTPSYLGDPSQFSTMTRAEFAFLLLTQGAPVCAGDYERIGLLIGETITIQELPLSICGRSQCGDSLNPRPGNSFIIVNMPSAVVTTPVCGLAHCGDALGQFEPAIMQTIIAEGVPLGIVPTFNYTG